jgi:glycosyltransferase involved in cell wall biosynthesis
VLWQGIVRPYKGIPFLLDSWRELLKRGTKATLVIVGTGDEECVSEIVRNVKENEMGASIRLELRFVSVDEVMLYHGAADIVVYPYKEITTSGALMTGASFGNAVICTSLPPFREVVTNGVNGMLVDYGNAGQFADALESLIHDRRLRDRLGERLKSEMREVPQWTEIAQQTAQCYRAAVAVSKPSAHAARTTVGMSH